MQDHEWGWEPDLAAEHKCRTADGVEIHVGMWVVGYDGELCQVTGEPNGYNLRDNVCWPCAGHQGHWWDTTTKSYDGSRMTTRGVAERQIAPQMTKPTLEASWTSLWGLILPADDVEVGDQVTAKNKDGIKKTVVVEAIQLFEAKTTGNVFARCLVREVGK